MFMKQSPRVSFKLIRNFSKTHAMAKSKFEYVKVRIISAINKE